MKITKTKAARLVWVTGRAGAYRLAFAPACYNIKHPAQRFTPVRLSLFPSFLAACVICAAIRSDLVNP